MARGETQSQEDWKKDRKTQTETDGYADRRELIATLAKLGLDQNLPPCRFDNSRLWWRKYLERRGMRCKNWYQQSQPTLEWTIMKCIMYPLWRYRLFWNKIYSQQSQLFTINLPLLWHREFRKSWFRQTLCRTKLPNILYHYSRIGAVYEYGIGKPPKVKLHHSLRRFHVTGVIRVLRFSPVNV